MKAVVAALNQEKALVGAFSVITNLRMDLFEALVSSAGMATSLSRGPGRVWRHLSSQQPARSLHEDFTSHRAETQPRRTAKVRVVVNYLPNPPPTTTVQVVHNNTDLGKYYLQLLQLLNSNYSAQYDS